MARFLGTAGYVLERAPPTTGSTMRLVRYSAICLHRRDALFFWRAASETADHRSAPPSRTATSLTGSLFSFVMGIGLYGLTYLYPVFLARVGGYSSMMIGETMFVTGIAMFVAAPIVGRLSTRLDPRIMIAAGFAGFALGTWQASMVTKDWAFHELLIPQILRGGSLMLCMVPITNAALGTLAPQQLKTPPASST